VLEGSLQARSGRRLVRVVEFSARLEPPVPLVALEAVDELA